MELKNKIIILAGLSCNGKDTVLNELISKHGFNSFISHTTRNKRPSETEGKEYFFISKEEFFEKDKSGQFVESRHYITTVNGLRDTFYYGLSKSQVDNRNKPCCVILDKQGSIDFANYIGIEDVVLIYLEIDKEISRQRNIKRGDYDEIEFERRYKSDSKSFKGIEQISDAIINTNQPVDEIVQQVLECYNYYN